MGYILFLQQCKGKEQSPTDRIGTILDTIVRIDTQRIEPVIVHLQSSVIREPTIIYIDSSTNRIETAYIDTNSHKAVNMYTDSLEDENLTLYYNSVIDGELLKNSFDYQLKIPKLITKTVEITKPYPMPVSSLNLQTGIGTDTRSFSSLKIGLQFVSAKGWAIGYDYDAFQRSHHLTMGLKIIQFKPKK